ncbi:MAG: hypothetical protein K2K53_02190, partial [Oscillospiraceae bacterium]|nr:hypothetical protein [Oscillospiraceae bacterium]
TCHVLVRVCLDSPILSADGSPTGYYHLAGEFCPEEQVKTIAYVDYDRELAKPTVLVGDHGALLGAYESHGNTPCDVHTEAPVIDDPGPDVSGEPVTSDPPPVETDPSVDITEPPAPPETDPPVEPTVEPTEPPPATEPPTEPPYIPAADPEQAAVE